LCHPDREDTLGFDCQLTIDYIYYKLYWILVRDQFWLGEIENIHYSALEKWSGTLMGELDRIQGM